MIPRLDIPEGYVRYAPGGISYGKRKQGTANQYKPGSLFTFKEIRK